MKRLLLSTIALAAIAFTAVACGQDNSVDLSKAPAQTGGPEQGEWRDQQGTALSLTSGKFTYKKGSTDASGTYTISNGNITMTGDSGQNFTASFPDKNGPITIDGEKLTKVD